MDGWEDQGASYKGLAMCREIISVVEDFKINTKYWLGSGKSFLFWYDISIRDGLLAAQFSAWIKISAVMNRYRPIPERYFAAIPDSVSQGKISPKS